MVPMRCPSGVALSPDLRDPLLPVRHLPGLLSRIEKPQIQGLGVGYPAEVLHRGVQGAVLGPGFGRATMSPEMAKILSNALAAVMGNPFHHCCLDGFQANFPGPVDLFF